MAELPREIRIVLLSGLGDVVHGLPVVNGIKAADPTVRITWVVEPMPASILANHESIDRIVVFRRRDGLSGIRDLQRDLKALPKPDVSLNLNVYAKSIWPTVINRSPRRLGFGSDRSFEGVHLASNEHLPTRPWAHTADMFLEFAEQLGVTVKRPEWNIRFTENESKAQSDYFAQFGGRPVATIIPASATMKKDWLPERFAEVADALDSDFGFQVVIAGGPGSREGAIAEEIASLSRAKIFLAMGDSVRRLASIVAGSNLVIAPDTGPVHIARAFDVPVVGIYGHTNPWRVGPWRKFSDLWIDHYTPVGAEPDPSDRAPKWEVMPTISASEVIAKISVAVEKYGATREKSLQL
ncbi:MAG TPA: glycosyltransferase family 9 protein [Gemmatimonadaceae bacterium]|nr:glycosyltransferase family 9 protein [Gemmatimonadaceae bacterium]